MRLGIREVPYGELDLAPRALDRTRVERGGPPPICQRPEADNRIDLRRPVRMNPGSVWAGMAEPYSQAHRTPREKAASLRIRRPRVILPSHRVFD